MMRLIAIKEIVRYVDEDLIIRGRSTRNISCADTVAAGLTGVAVKAGSVSK